MAVLEDGLTNEDAGVEKGSQEPTPFQNKDPREGVANWRWAVILLLGVIITVTNGYDLSNVANIQATLYTTFGHIELLPFCALSYSMAHAAGAPLVRKISDFIDPRILIVSGAVVFSVGVIICGAAPTISAFIVGRTVSGLGGALLQQASNQYMYYFARPVEVPMVSSLVGFSWVVGLIVGPIIGAAFAETAHLSWRWAFYVLAPIITGIVVPSTAALPLPPPLAHGSRPLLENLANLDILGFILFSVSLSLFVCAAVLSGTTWPWDSAPVVTLWVFAGLGIVGFVSQQVLCIGTSLERRLMPVDILAPRWDQRTMPLVFTATCLATVGYAMGLYYTPLFFSFAAGDGPVRSAVHMFPLVGTFIVSVLLSGALLPRVRRYAAVYMTSGCLMVVSSAILVTTTDAGAGGGLDEPRVMGATALLGAAVGAAFPIGLSVSSFMLPWARGPDAVLLNVLALSGVAPAALAVAGCAFGNAGFRALRTALGPLGFSDAEVREALAGASARLGGDPRAGPLAAQAVTVVIARLFYILLAAGILMIAAAACMRWESLDFQARQQAMMGKVPGRGGAGSTTAPEAAAAALSGLGDEPPLRKESEVTTNTKDSASWTAPKDRAGSTTPQEQGGVGWTTAKQSMVPSEQNSMASV